MPKIYLIGNAHLDPVWLWRWQDGFAEALSTYRSALDRMKDFPYFKFTSACAVYYQWIEKTDPEMFKEIQQRVKEGRWNIVGGWFLQPDCNIPCGESFARHALLSQRYFKEKFGVTAKTGYNVDSFGHNANLPKILKQSGMDNYVFMRPDKNEKDLKESLFMWESDDGSQVCTFRIPECYCIHSSRLHMIENIKELADEEQTDYMAFYGVGNHGGGPTIELIDAINNMGIENMIYSTPDEYFANVDKSKLNTLNDELQHHARGCYSASAFVKQSNRKCENNILAAERFATLAKELTGHTYPQKKINKAWKNLMFNQFHDILCGCSIKQAYEDAGYLYGEIMSITEQEINLALQKIAWNINTMKGEKLPAYRDPDHWKAWTHEVLGTPVVVFNPHPWQVTADVIFNMDSKSVTDCDGNEIPFQMVRGQQTNVSDLYYTSFTATVPALGYAVYRLFVEKEQSAVFEQSLSASETVLENNKISVELDTMTGDICSYFDKENNTYLIDKPCKAVLLDETDCDTWAHNKDSLGKTVGMFDNPEFTVIESGNVRSTIRVVTKHCGSTLQRDYTIFPDNKTVRVKTTVDFHEKHRVLKFTFPMTDKTVVAQIPYGTIKRTGYTGEEPCSSWIASGKLGIANDSKYGYDTENGEMRLTVLRSAIFADHYGERDNLCEYMEQGVHEFTYTLFPYEDNCSADKTAEELNLPVRVLPGAFREGTLPEYYSGIECDDSSVTISAIKQSEDGKENIIRMYETNGEDCKAEIKLFGKKIEVELSHNELKTVDENGKETNLIEW